MSAAHTPGPWVFIQDGGWRIRAQESSLMGNETYYPWTPENIADWQLIAAAPDLLEALKGLLKEADDEINETSTELLAFGLTDPECPEHVRRQLAAFISARAAIAKATGETE